MRQFAGKSRGYFQRRQRSLRCALFSTHSTDIDRNRDISGVSGDGGLSYAFSGCGWLVPFYFGAIDVFRQNKVLHRGSIVAGTSGGGKLKIEEVVTAPYFMRSGALDSSDVLLYYILQNH